MKEQDKKKLFLKKRTVSFLSENQMDKVLGATGDECFSATCPGDQGCDDTDADCPTVVGCPVHTDSCPPQTENNCPVGTDQSSGCGTINPGTSDCPSEGGWCTDSFGCDGFETRYVSVCSCNPSPTYCSC